MNNYMLLSQKEKEQYVKIRKIFFKKLLKNGLQNEFDMILYKSKEE